MLITAHTRGPAEMRDWKKPSPKRPGNSAHLQQYALLSNADISTLHTYCSRSSSGISRRRNRMSRVDDTGQAARLLDEAVDSTITELYESPGADGQALIDHYPDKDRGHAAAAVHPFAVAGRPADSCTRSRSRPPRTPCDHTWYQVTLHEARQLLSGAQQLIAECVDIAQSPAARRGT